jgi:hypothetical protein
MTIVDGSVIVGKEILKDSNHTLPWNLVILSKGYTSNDIQYFSNQVRLFVYHFIKTAPFDLFRLIIN